MPAANHNWLTMSLVVGPIDLAIVCLYLAGMTAIGLWFGRQQRTAADYLLGGRNLPWWTLLLSIVSTETSAVTFLSVPGIAFAKDGDMRFLQLTLGYMVGRCAIVFLFLPHYFQGELFTAYDVLHRRFGGVSRQTASLLFLVTRNLADGLRLYLAALVLQQMLDWPLSACVAVMGTCTIVYTFAGGLKSVVWADCVQFAIYILGAILAGVVLLQLLPGGWEQLVTFGQEHNKFRIFDFSLDLTQKYTFAAGLVGGFFLTLATHGTDQLMVQRYLAARSLPDAGKALALSGVVVCLQFALFLLLGVGLACFYASFPPAEQLSGDQAFARFLIDRMPVGALGITLAAVFAAAMSSSLNSAAAAAVNDIYAPLVGEKSPQRLLWASRVLTVVFGVVQIGVGIAGPYLARSVVDSVLAIASFTAGVVLGVFFLGVLTRRVSQAAALAGLLAGLGTMTYVAFFTPLAWPWYACVGSLTTFLAGMAASLVWPQRERQGASRR